MNNFDRILEAERKLDEIRRMRCLSMGIYDWTATRTAEGLVVLADGRGSDRLLAADVLRLAKWVEWLQSEEEGDFTP